jgi:protein phosphatase
MFKFRVVDKTDQGIREMNQDHHLVFKNKHGNLFAIVADGMGGHVGGQIASKFAVKTMKAYFKNMNFDSMTEEDIQHQLVKSIHFLSREFKRIAEQKPAFSDMGTTLNMNIFTKNILYTVNVGDSRATKIDADGLQQISEDHNLAQLAKVDKRFERFAKDANLLTSSLGPTKETKVDVFQTEITKPGVLIVTSDGIHQFVSEKFIVEKILDKKLQLNVKVNEIMNEAIRNKTNDNMTIVAVEYDL